MHLVLRDLSSQRLYKCDLVVTALFISASRAMRVLATAAALLLLASVRSCLDSTTAFGPSYTWLSACETRYHVLAKL
jgi:hypothetical protein